MKATAIARYLVVMVLAVSGLATYHPAHATDTDPLSAFLASLAPPPSDKALAAIPDIGRKLLALRSYVRARNTLAERWSWTDAEIEAFQGSPAQIALLAEVNAIKIHFAAANPGYEIYANTKVRSLDKQIRNWNVNASVDSAAEEILAAWMETFGSGTQASDMPDPRKAQIWLAGFRTTERPWIAAPGLTLHGRASAIDFQVMQNGRIIAGTRAKDIESVWRAEKWDEKLKASIEAAGPSFSGPLTRPDEPWHYDYDPMADDTSRNDGSGRAGRSIETRQN